MVKWLRRRPLTAESGVRIPLGLPNKKRQIKSLSFYFMYLVPSKIFLSVKYLYI